MERTAQGPRGSSLQAEVYEQGRVSTGTPTDIEHVLIQQTNPQLIDQLNQRSEEVNRNFNLVEHNIVQTQEALHQISQTVEHVHLRAEERTQANRNHLEEERESRRQESLRRDALQEEKNENTRSLIAELQRQRGEKE